MELKVKAWKVGQVAGVTVIQGTYAVMTGDVEVATQNFNDEYGGTKINFPRELEDKVKLLTEEINNSIKESF